MMTPSEKLREKWLEALLPRVETSGWTRRVARIAAHEAGLSPGEQALAAPNGLTDLIDHFFERAGDDMFANLASEDLDALRTHERVAAALKAWLAALEPNKPAVAKAAGRGLLPLGAGAAAKRVWSVADAIWKAAGDTATDYNRQTKRGLLSAVIPSIVLYWLEHEDEDDLDRFIARRLDQAMQLGRSGSKVIGPVIGLFEQFQSRTTRRES